MQMGVVSGLLCSLVQGGEHHIAMYLEGFQPSKSYDDRQVPLCLPPLSIFMRIYSFCTFKKILFSTNINVDDLRLLYKNDFALRRLTHGTVGERKL